jgi:DNA-binding NarL/FixJ family response regulator
VHRPETHHAQPACVGILAADPLRTIGLQTILEENLHLQTVLLGEGNSLRHRRPSIVVIDLGSRDTGGFPEAIARLRRILPAAAVVVLARRDMPELLERAVAAGARGFLPETAEIEEIQACINALLEGTPWIPAPKEPEPGADRALRSPEEKLSKRFTPKEREVLRWLTQGRSNREIATTMHIDEATVKAHLGRMLRKAKASNRVELTLRVLAEQP